MLELYPRSEINITVHVLEADGSIICTIINAITLALMDAGIAMSDMVTACSVGHVRGQFCADVNQVEQNSGGAFIPLAMKARSEDIIFLQLDSKISVNNLEEAMTVAVDGCRVMKTYLEKAMQKCMSEALESHE